MTTSMEFPLDRLGRPLRSLRISVTDRCNLRCGYCMPEEEYTWLPRADILSFEEMACLAGVFRGLGVDRIRLTGGEPLLRRGMDQLVSMLGSIDGIEDLALTTNGIRLADHASSLQAAGLNRITVSLDTLKSDRYAQLTRRDDLGSVLGGIDSIVACGFRNTKLNTVVMRGSNDDEVGSILAFAAERGIEARFIEYMDVGGATRWTSKRVVSREEILDLIAREHGKPEPIRAADDRSVAAPAGRYILPSGVTFGVVASTTSPFCASCDRSRLTADGRWFHCLYASEGRDLRPWLRGSQAARDLPAALRSAWQARQDRGAEDRLNAADRSPESAEHLRDHPHLEMHTRGG